MNFEFRIFEASTPDNKVTLASTPDSRAELELHDVDGAMSLTLSIAELRRLAQAAHAAAQLLEASR